MRTHQEIDQRSLALHRLVADKIRSDPALFDQAQHRLMRWKLLVSPDAHHYLDEWQRLFDLGMNASLAVAVEESEQATAMRQSSPLSCLLTNQERFRFLKTWNQGESDATQ